jgi:hypothetical protein
MVFDFVVGAIGKRLWYSKGNMAAWRKEQTDLRGAPETCAIAVVYENIVVRDVAIGLCDALARKFFEDLEFDISWWRFDYLADPDISLEAAGSAAGADLILVCLDRDDLPPEIQAWLERCLAQRQSTGGALAVVRSSGTSDSAAGAETYLRLVARRANLDYLPLGSTTTARLVDRLREDEISSDVTGLNQTPDHPHHSSGWGINE